jgi:hypothetical protein
MVTNWHSNTYCYLNRFVTCNVYHFTLFVRHVRHRGWWTWNILSKNIIWMGFVRFVSKRIVKGNFFVCDLWIFAHRQTNREMQKMITFNYEIRCFINEFISWVNSTHTFCQFDFISSIFSAAESFNAHTHKQIHVHVNYICGDHTSRFIFRLYSSAQKKMFRLFQHRNKHRLHTQKINMMREEKKQSSLTHINHVACCIQSSNMSMND